MATQDIQQEMMQYFMQLSDKEKKSVLQMIKTFLQGKTEPSKRITLEQYNMEINEAMARMDAGEFVSHEDVVEMSKTWVNG